MEPDSPALQSEAEVLQKTATDDLIYKELDKIAKFLAEKRASVVNSLPSRVLERKGEELLNQLAAARSLQTRFTATDGRIFEVTFALAKRSSVNNLTERLRVAVDPDDYPMDDSGNFIVYFLDDAGNLSSETTSIEEYNQKAPYPLLLVNTFEEVPARNSFSKASSENSIEGINSPFYLSVRAIDLKRENDPVGYEEFEIFVREESIITETLNCDNQTAQTTVNVDLETDFLFDGHYRYDAVGRYRYFPDINVDNGGWITMPNDIALVLLSSEKRGLTPIEDDHAAGVHHNSNSFPCGTGVHTQNVTAYRWDLGQNQQNLVIFRVYHDGDADDVYSYSGIFGVTQSNCGPMVNTERQFPNTDMDLKLIVEDNPQIPPNPPVINGSIVSGHPKLTWSAVPGADAYKVTLNDTYASQTLNWTITTTSFEDPPRNPVMFAQTSFPSLNYTVKTIDNGLESVPSNAKIYQYVE